MNELFNRIERDRTVYLKNRDRIALATCKLILGEIHRDPNKDRSDDNVFKIIRSLRKMTLKSPIKDPLLVDMIDKYLPLNVSDIDVIEWIKSQYDYQHIVDMGNKRAYSIIGKTKNHFGDKEIDSVCIRDFIDRVFDVGIEAYKEGVRIDIPDIDIDIELWEELKRHTEHKNNKKITNESV